MRRFSTTRRRSTSTGIRIRICPSASPGTSASACTWPGSKGRVFFEELLDAFPTIELTGEPVRIRSNLNNSLKRLPVRLTA